MVLQVIILARESGLKLELSDIPVENLVPEPLRVRTDFINYTVLSNSMYFCTKHGYLDDFMQVSASTQEFMQKLPKFDQEFSKKQEDADTAGEVSN